MSERVGAPRLLVCARAPPASGGAEHGPRPSPDGGPRSRPDPPGRRTNDPISVFGDEPVGGRTDRACGHGLRVDSSETETFRERALDGERKVVDHNLALSANDMRREFSYGPEGIVFDANGRLEAPIPPVRSTLYSGPLFEPLLERVQVYDDCEEALERNVFSVSSNSPHKHSSESRDIQDCNGDINYQFLEQNISHQSILNQSISILNQQVAADRYSGQAGGGGRLGHVDSEGVVMNNVHQFVRTPEGMVLAVLPPQSACNRDPCTLDRSAVPSNSVGVVSQCVDPIGEVSPSNARASDSVQQSDSAPSITVPLGWRRIVTGSSVLYISPSGAALGAHAQLREYLQTPGTCKCGLQCPLRPESTFSFDPKVASKPYQVPTGGDLNKLCNHKRKLLAALQSSSHSQPATPPPQLQFHHHQQEAVRKGKTVEAPAHKKKPKKKASLQAGVSVSQLMAQRERAQHGAPADYKAWPSQLDQLQEIIDDSRTDIRPLVVPGRISSHSCPPVFSTASQQITPNMMPVDSNEHLYKQETHANTPGSHYLTVNSGYINQPYPIQRFMPGISYQTNGTPGSPTMNIGQPVLGTNGQIIGVHTGVKTDHTRKTIAMNQQIRDDDDTRKTFEKSKLKKAMKYTPGKQGTGDGDSAEASNIFCGGLNQVPPEVVQKIDQQQQIFIQQNQKQIQMAMKGIKPQMSENSLQQPKNPYQQQPMPHGQLVIQNGTVVNANPGKTPPWQMKRPEPNAGSNNQHQQQRVQKSNPEQNWNSGTQLEGVACTSNMLTGDFNVNRNEQNINPMYSRVPPLHMNYPPTAFSDTKKKLKASPNKKSKIKKVNSLENKNIAYGNNSMRSMQESKKTFEFLGNPSPSFIDDPSGYLAQQTVLLNNTISRQVTNMAFDSGLEKPLTSTSKSTSLEILQSRQTKSLESVHQYKTAPQHTSPLQNNIPDSSVLSDKQNECCKGCTGSMKYHQMHTEQAIRKYNMKQIYDNKIELDAQTNTSSPNHSFDENPVTSSTFIERMGSQNSLLSDSRGPIQGGTVSTSNVSPLDTLQLPEPSPTPSNSSRNTDTPQSNNSGSIHISSSCPFAIPSPAYSNPGSNRDSSNSNPATPTPATLTPANVQPGLYNSPGPPQQNLHTTISGSQMINFISNHNVNRNLMEVENISFSNANTVMKGSPTNVSYRSDQKKIMSNNMTMPYCPPPHLGGGPLYSLAGSNYMQNLVTTMASGHSVIRDTITSVLAGKAHTATTSINGRPQQPPNMCNSYAIPPNHPDPFLNTVNLPTSYPMHIAGSAAQHMLSRTPLEMVQNVVSNIPHSRHETTTVQSQMTAHTATKTSNVPAGQILISSTGQIIIPNQGSAMPPPAPKNQNVSSISPVQAASIVTNVTASVTQVIPTVGGVQQVMNQPTVLVNTMQSPFMLQPQMMTVDGQVVQQNTVLPHIMTGSLVQQGQSPNDGNQDLKHGLMQRMAMISPESKKRAKKRKNQQSLTNVLHIAAPQQTTGSVLLHHTSPQHHTSQQFSPRGFQLSPNNNMSPGSMLQALTIVPGKTGSPAHIVMNGQGCTNNFGTQQIITNTSPTQQINLLQPVNLINNGSGVVQNFPTFQQFIVPNIGGVMMTADGTAIIQDSSTGLPVQLQLQNVNGQNVLTPIQNQSVLTTGGNTGVVIRTQNPHGKIIQSQHSPGAQFLSPNSHIMMNSPTFSGQLSPLIANVSPTNVTFNTSPHHVRSANIQAQDLIQCNQIGQAMMVPLSPKPITTAANNRSSSTFVQQNTTIVQHQTTLVSNPASNNLVPNITQNVQGSGNRLSIDPAVLFNHNHKTHKNRHISIENHIENTMASTSPIQEKALTFPQNNHSIESEQSLERIEFDQKQVNNPNMVQMHMNEGFNQLLMNHGQQGVAFTHVRHSVSTQTLLNQQQNSKSPPVTFYQQISGSSPPDTTTHSPLGPQENMSSSPQMYGGRSVSIQGNYADTTTKSPEPMDSNSSAMVQCVSSSEPDVAEERGREQAAWPAQPGDFSLDNGRQGMMGVNMSRNNRSMFCTVESSDAQHNQTISVTSVNNQQTITITPNNFYERTHVAKRKSDFGEQGHTYRDKIMRTNFDIHSDPKDMYNEANFRQNMQKNNRNYIPFDGTMQTEDAFSSRHSLNDNEPKADPISDPTEDGNSEPNPPEFKPATKVFAMGDLVWGPAKGYPSWPGKLVSAPEGNKCLVRWFGGDKLLTTVAPERLQTLTEGLEAHHAARTKCRKSRKLNTHLEKAIQEAMSELDNISKSCGSSDAKSSPPGNAKKSRPKGRPPKDKGGQRKLNPVKIAPNPNTSKVSDGPGRLRSSR